ncbi:tyrosine-type recombinase/integrase [Agrobacterium rubi]|uniref:tyrosine-type recombinase/integrase n=1 Tax=Agrobacterium rubi TaxID=28099 RepID=UPI0015727EA1|nr:site-specific integrase [Agrobacterium rubi]NTE87261.1 site-specific integrase [Agrobacterium rubi]NTF03195.1 site-specific integrase [Agrobacterium rubi]
MPLTLYKRGKIWHYRGTVAGRLLRNSTETEDKKRAQRIAAEAEAEAWKSRLDGPESVLKFSQASITYRAAGKSTRYLDKVEDYWKDALVKSITAGKVRQGAIETYPDAKASTRNRQFIAVTQAVINHSAELELCSPIKVKRFPEDKSIKKPITWAWVSAFMQKANPHLGALACFMFMTGARVTEAINLKWADVDLDERRVLIRQTKTAVERRPHMPPELVVALANISGNREPDAKVFKYSTRSTALPQWNKAVKRAGIERLSFHACRHGFATSLLHRGIDPVTVAKLGGWASPQHIFTTYGHAMDDDTVTDMLSGTKSAQKENNIRFINKKQSLK